jgi:hypothetical protein
MSKPEIQMMTMIIPLNYAESAKYIFPFINIFFFERQIYYYK